MTQIKNIAFRNIFWLGGSNALSQAITWILTILIARILRPEDYGLVEMASIYIGFAEYLSEFGVGTAIIQKKEISEVEIRSTYLLSIVIGCFFTLVCVLMAPWLAYFFKENRLTPILYVLSSTFLISSVKNIQQSVMTRAMRFKEIAQIEALCKVSTSIISYGLALNGAGVWTLVIAYLLYNASQAFMYTLYERQSPGKLANLAETKRIFRFGLQVMLARILTILSQKTDMLIIGKLINTQVLGIYSLSMSLANKPLEKILSVLNLVLLPIFSQSQTDKLTIKRYFLKAFEMELLIMVPVYLFIVFSAGPLVQVVLGKRWIEIVVPLKVFGAVGIFMYFFNHCSMVVTALGKPRMHLHFTTILYIGMAISMLILGATIGFNGILISWGTVYPILTIIYLLKVLRLIEITPLVLLKCFRTSVLIACVMIPGFLLVQMFPFHHSWMILGSMVAVALISYLTALILFDRSKVSELLDLVRGKQFSGADIS